MMRRSNQSKFIQHNLTHSTFRLFARLTEKFQLNISNYFAGEYILYGEKKKKKHIGYIMCKRSTSLIMYLHLRDSK